MLPGALSLGNRLALDPLLHERGVAEGAEEDGALLRDGLGPGRLQGLALIPAER